MSKKLSADAITALYNLVDALQCKIVFNADDTKFTGEVQRKIKFGNNEMAIEGEVISDYIGTTRVTAFVRFSNALWAYLRAEAGCVMLFFFDGIASGYTLERAEDLKSTDAFSMLNFLQPHLRDAFVHNITFTQWKALTADEITAALQKPVKASDTVQKDLSA